MNSTGEITRDAIYETARAVVEQVVKVAAALPYLIEAGKIHEATHPEFALIVKRRTGLALISAIRSMLPTPDEVAFSAMINYRGVRVYVDSFAWSNAIRLRGGTAIGHVLQTQSGPPDQDLHQTMQQRLITFRSLGFEPVGIVLDSSPYHVAH
jgi:hypothetical protein